MLRLIIQTDRKHKNNWCEEEVCHDERRTYSPEIVNKKIAADGYDQDSNPSFETDSESGPRQEQEDDRFDKWRETPKKLKKHANVQLKELGWNSAEVTVDMTHESDIPQQRKMVKESSNMEPRCD